MRLVVSIGPSLCRAGQGPNAVRPAACLRPALEFGHFQAAAPHRWGMLARRATLAQGERSSPGQVSACQRPLAGAFFLTFSARGFSSAPDLAVMVLVGQQAREILAGGVAQQVAVHAHVVAKECLADAAVEQVGAEEIESLRFLPEGFGIHHAAALSWLV